MNTLEKVLVNRAQNGTYHKEELIEITKKLWITGDISETVKDQVLEIIREPPERLHIVFPPDGVEFRRRGRPQKERQKSPKELLIEALGLMEAEERKETA